MMWCFSTPLARPTGSTKVRLHATVYNATRTAPLPPPAPQVDERHAYLCAAAPLKEDMEYIRSTLLTASFKVSVEKVGGTLEMVESV